MYHRISLLLMAFAAFGSAPVQAECLSRPMSYDSGEEVPQDAPLYNLIEVPTDEVAAYKGLGYGAATCAADTSSRIVKIDGCTMARFGNEAVQQRFTTLLGVEPAKLCASTQKLKGKDATTGAPQ